MNAYIRGRVQADAAHTLALAANEEHIQHDGLRGRFRELLIDNLLTPWLPPYSACGTGTVIDGDNRVRESTQDDIIVFDRSLMPSVLASNRAPEGIFPLNGVLVRIEVKSTLTRTNLRESIRAAAEIQVMKFASPTTDRTWSLPLGMIFAYGSDLVDDPAKPTRELERMIDVVKEEGLYFNGACSSLPGPVGALCVAGRGCWGYGGVQGQGASRWLEAVRSAGPHEEILMFVGALSNSCFRMNAERQGRDPRLAVDGGIGNFILSTSTYRTVSVA